jgi:hypothetical protein
MAKKTKPDPDTLTEELELLLNGPAAPEPEGSETPDGTPGDDTETPPDGTPKDGTEAPPDGTPKDGTEAPPDGTPKDDTEAPPEKLTPYAGVTHFAYIGPALPDSRIKQNTILQGTFADVCAYLAPEIEAHPQVGRLIVPVSELSTAAARTGKKGNILNKYFTEVASALSQKGRVK